MTTDFNAPYLCIPQAHYKPVDSEPTMRFEEKYTDFTDTTTAEVLCLEDPNIAQVNYIGLKNAWEHNMHMYMLHASALDPDSMHGGNITRILRNISALLVLPGCGYVRIQWLIFWLPVSTVLS